LISVDDFDNDPAFLDARIFARREIPSAWRSIVIEAEKEKKKEKIEGERT